MTHIEERAAALTVAANARDAADCRELLAMLGLLPEVQATTDRRVFDGDVGHGRYRLYLAGCRCDACRAKNAETVRKSRARAKSDPSRADRAGHGKANTYKNHGCRCEPCRAALAKWTNDYNARRRKAALREAS
ncbi:hypothetical protein AB0B89_31025 [Sphaerisporangium sp. NPDC049002]|uniref:hypothetical protein n=1 Tax=Sphaerisporangium sp. NPDC049002 TaxID=3155392 RepID=UPI0033C5039D